MAGATGRNRAGLRGRGPASLTRLILINPNTDAATTAAMLRIAHGAVDLSVKLDGRTAAFGAPLILDEPALATAARAVHDLAPRLRAEAPDGVIVAAFGDPGLTELRDQLDCPVTGIAEAGMAEAAAGRRPFAVVTTTPHLENAIAARAATYGYAALFLGTTITPGDPKILMADPERLVEALAEACVAAIRDLGAAALVIGGGPLAVAARVLAATVGVPLIEPVPAAARLALRRADQKRRLGL